MARRSNGEGSFYQQKDKSWVYQVTYGRKEDGSPYRKAFKGRTKTICKERRAQWEEEQARIKAEEEAQAAESTRLEELRAAPAAAGKKRIVSYRSLSFAKVELTR